MAMSHAHSNVIALMELPCELARMVDRIHRRTFPGSADSRCIRRTMSVALFEQADGTRTVRTLFMLYPDIMTTFCELDAVVYGLIKIGSQDAVTRVLTFKPDKVHLDLRAEHLVDDDVVRELIIALRTNVDKLTASYSGVPVVSGLPDMAERIIECVKLDAVLSAAQH